MATPTPARESVSARSLKLMKGPLSYIHAFFRASKEGLWCAGSGDGAATSARRGGDVTPLPVPPDHPFLVRGPRDTQGGDQARRLDPAGGERCPRPAPLQALPCRRRLTHHTPTPLAHWQVAENKLNNVAVLDKLEAVTDMPSTVMNYANMKGIPELTTALAALMHHTFLPDVELDPQCLVGASGEEGGGSGSGSGKR